MAGQPTPTKGTLRVFRGAVLALASTTLAIAAHGIGGGRLPDAVLTLLLVFGTSTTGIALASKRYSLVGVIVLLGVTQLVIHLLLSVESNYMSTMNAQPVNGMAMFGAHAAAVLVTSLLLVWADTLLFALVKALRRLLPVLVAAAPVVVERHCPAPTALPCGRLTAVWLCRGNARRGPPVAA